MNTTALEYLAVHFSYGMNLDPTGLLRRAPDSEALGPARLNGWRLHFDHVATVVEDPDRTAWGYLWGISGSGLDSLDRLEGYPTLYDRRRVDVETSEGTVPTFTYFLRNPGTAPPSPSYLDTIQSAYIEHDLPLSELRRAVQESHAPASPPEGSVAGADRD